MIDKPYLWLYWDTPHWWHKMYSYIDMCYDTIKYYCKKDYTITLINNNNIKQYLPDIRQEFFELGYPHHKSDYARCLLIEKYGGVWLDLDTLLIKPIKFLIDINAKYGGFWGTSRSNGKGSAYNGVIGFAQNNSVIKQIVAIQNDIIDEKGSKLFHCNLGPYIFDSYTEPPPYILPVRNFYSISWSSSHRLQLPGDINRYIKDDVYGFSIFNRKLTKKRKYFYKMTRDEIMNTDCLFTDLYNEAMK